MGCMYDAMKVFGLGAMLGFFACAIGITYLMSAAQKEAERKKNERS